MLYILYPLSAILMIGMPIALGIFLARKARAPWALFGIGCLTFIGSQLVHLPLNAAFTALFHSWWPQGLGSWNIPFNAVFLGLTAGLCEETARYVGYRWLARNARAFRDALMLGAGHGGIEAIILGLLVAFTFIQMVIINRTGLDSLNLPANQLELARQQVAAYWSMPWYMAILGAVERMFAITAHVSMSVMVLQVFTRRNWGWLALAIGFHALMDAVAVYAVQSQWSLLVVEALAVPFAVAGLGIIWLLRPRDGLVPTEPERPVVPGASQITPTAAQQQQRAQQEIIDSRYT